MSDYLGIVAAINRDCKYLVENFKLIEAPGHYNISLFKIAGNSYAINRYDSEPVKVQKWFDKFWLYLEVKFTSESSKQNRKIVYSVKTNISISIYEGDDTDVVKIQLFRAEWDDWNDPEHNHSQPHWHITSSQAIEKTIEEYSIHFNNGDFIRLLEGNKSELFDVKKIHFAMNGNWQDDHSHIHTIKSSEQVSKWLKGLVNHIRVELEA